MYPPTATVTATAAAAEEGSATTLSDVPTDILQSHILTRLDGLTLASASCVSSQLHSLAAQDHLWTTVCHSTWPSTSTTRLRYLISNFSFGARCFFSLSFPLLLPSPTATITTTPPPPELISAVDIHYKNKLIFTKVQETETVTDWFRCSPFRIDLLDPKDVVPTTIPHPESDGACTALSEEMILSWVLIDPIGRRAANISSHKPVSLQRHWLSGEVQLLFVSILGGGEWKGPTSDLVQCGIVVTCGSGGSEGGDMQVREVSLQVEDMDGMQLTGKKSLGILHRALDYSRRGNKMKRREEEGRMRYREFLEMKRDRRERKLRTEGTLDMLCVAFGFGVTIFAAFWWLFLCIQPE
ncbi:hypothetical protein U1Q18_014206 [Sarracenia purpurea var. burkii]